MSNYNTKYFVICAIVFVVNYVFLYLMSALKVFNSINATAANHIFIVAFFIFGVFLFEYLNKELEFNFAEIYVGILLLILLYFAFFFAYWIYSLRITGVFTYLINCPYIFIAISFFAGWLAFFIYHYKNKSE